MGPPLNSVSVFEFDAGMDQSDQFGAVDFPPSFLGGVEQLVGHHQATSPRPGTFRHLGSGPHRRKSRLDRVGGPQMGPVGGGEVVERQQHVPIVGQFGDCFGILVAIVGHELVDLCFGIGTEVAVDNNFGVGGLRNSHSDLLNALPFQPATAGRYYVSIHAPNGGIAPNRVYTLSVQSDDYADSNTTTAVVAVGGSIRT